MARRSEAALADPEWASCNTAAEVHAAVSTEYVDILLLDLRSSGSSAADAVRQGFALLDELDSHKDVEARYAFHRIVALVADADLVRADNWPAAWARSCERIPTPKRAHSSKRASPKPWKPSWGRVLGARLHWRRPAAVSPGSTSSSVL